MSSKRKSGGAQSEIWTGRVAALGASPDALAVGLGERVGFLGANSLAHVECWLGVPAFGRVMVDLNFRLAEPELAFMVDDCELEVLIVDRDQLEVGRALRQRCVPRVWRAQHFSWWMTQMLHVDPRDDDYGRALQT
jgi:long-subunit acyl-CoA synthetase (AMP-forming)